MRSDYNPNEVEIVEAMPAPDGRSAGHEGLFKSLAGATIIRIGAPNKPGLEGGGLVIDYRLGGEQHTRRTVFAFNENGMWLEFDGEPSPPRP